MLISSIRCSKGAAMDMKTAEETSHFLHSTLRERTVEHVFVGDALRRLWQRGVTDVEVLRSEFDAYGSSSSW